MTTRITVRKKVRRKRKKLNWRKIATTSLIILAVAALLGTVCHRSYERFRRNRILANAQKCFKSHDYRAAYIHANRVLQIQPGDVDASLILARVMEEFRPEDAIAWRQKVLEQRPSDFDNALALVDLELDFGQFSAARNVLTLIGMHAANNAKYHYLCGRAALAAKDPKRAEASFQKAVELDPGRKEYQFALARAQLRTGDPQKRKEAVESLERLALLEDFKKRALRVLSADTLRNYEAQAADHYSDKLASGTGATFEDQLARLEVLKQLSSSGFVDLLESLQVESLSSTKNMLRLLIWLRDHNMSITAVDWADTMPRKIASEPLLKLALAECHMRIGDWDEARDLTGGENWGPCKFLALAFQARVLRHEGRTALASNTWDAALLETKKSLRMQVQLLRAAQSWRWDAEAEGVLWRLTELENPPDFVFGQLESRLVARSDSESLCKLWKRKLALVSDYAVSGKLAALLLLRDEKLEEAHRMANTAYLADSKNPFCASAFAYSMLKQSNIQAALQTFSSMPTESLEEPVTATFYAAALIAAKDQEKAREVVLKIKSDTLLPEQKRLLDENRSALGLPKS